ncbi:MAG: nucleoside hydrolase [Nitrososphaerota archaeon]|nr:nucleoside hydrolase [Nitrososphaerota archaeon]
MKVILDMDPGVDDALALILALRSRELDVLAVTTVAGNTLLSNATVNALKVLELIGCEVPVAMGESRSMMGYELAMPFTYIHGHDGLGDLDLPIPNKKAESVHAIDLIIDKVKSYNYGEITIIATGPLTNIAKFIIKEPKVAERVNKIVSMGGAFHTTPYGFGNQTPVAEFNVFRDPEAASIVYNSGLKVVAVGLDVTMNPSTFINRDTYERISKKDTKISKFIANVIKRSIDRYGFFALHDPLAVAVSIDPTLVKIEPYHVDVEMKGEFTRGQTIIDRRWWLKDEREKKNYVDVCIDVDGDRFLKMFMERVIVD